MVRAVFAIPGDISMATGGYAYARRVLDEARGAGLELDVLGLPASFPFPSEADLAETARALSALDPMTPVLLDGLAGGALTDGMIEACPAPVAMLCHHPLAREAGLSPAQSATLARSEAAALGAAAHVITTSDATAQILQSDYGVASDRLTVARPGTDPAPVATGTRGCAILSVGSLTPRKRHGMLLACLAPLTAQDWSLRIVGALPEPSALPALQAEAEALGLADRVEVLGPRPRADLDQLYASSDLFVLASEYEGYGMAFTEAMAHGLPVLGIDTGAVAEATLGAARLVPDNAFGDALATLIADVPERARLAAACRDAAARLPRWADTAHKIAAALRAIEP